MAKLWTFLERRPAEFGVTVHRRVETNLAQSDNDLEVFQQTQLAQKKRAAIQDFRRKQFVQGRCTSTCGRNVAVDQTKSILTRNRCRLVRKAEFVKGTVEPVSTSISCKHSAGAVPSVCCRCETHEKDLGVWIAEAWVWLSPILPVLKPPGFLLSNFLAPPDQSWTSSASHDLLLNFLERTQRAISGTPPCLCVEFNEGFSLSNDLEE